MLVSHIDYVIASVLASYLFGQIVLLFLSFNSVVISATLVAVIATKFFE